MIGRICIFLVFWFIFLVLAKWFQDHEPSGEMIALTAIGGIVVAGALSGRPNS